jgi:hypothetical protein
MEKVGGWVMSVVFVVGGVFVVVGGGGDVVGVVVRKVSSQSL